MLLKKSLPWLKVFSTVAVVVRMGIAFALSIEAAANGTKLAD